MKKASFNFYPDDYLGGTLHFRLEQHGAYLLLLMLQFKQGPFTKDQAAQLFGGYVMWDEVKEKFLTDGYVYWNARLEKEMKRTPPVASGNFKRPELAEVVYYFERIGLSGRARTEGEKFMNHYTSNGWRVGGKSAMKDWQAACRTWKSRMDEKAVSGSKTEKILDSMAEAKRLNRG